MGVKDTDDVAEDPAVAWAASSDQNMTDYLQVVCGTWNRNRFI